MGIVGTTYLIRRQIWHGAFPRSSAIPNLSDSSTRAWNRKNQPQSMILFGFVIQEFTDRRRRRKLTDKNLPNAFLQIPEFAADSQMYRDLLEMERRLDWTMTRKRVEVQDALQRIIPVSIVHAGGVAPEADAAARRRREPYEYS